MKFVLTLAAGLLAASLSHAQTVEELEAAEDATTAIWETMPLTQRSVAFVTAASTGYGQYEQRETNVFKPGEPLITYVEPIGYDWQALDDGRYTFGFVVDVVLKTEDGTVVHEQKEFLKTEQTSHVQNQEFSIDLTLTINGAPEGVYSVAYTIKDIVTDETSTFEQAFEIGG